MLDLLAALLIYLSNPVHREAVLERAHQTMLAVNPPPRKPRPYFAQHTLVNCIVTDHGGRWDLPRLWTRGGYLEIGIFDAYVEIYARLDNPVLIAGAINGDQRARQTILHWRGIARDFQRIVAHTQMRFATDADVAAVRDWAQHDGHEFVVMSSPDNGYAHVSYDQSVWIPHIPIGPTGWPGLAVLYHEMTHYMQFGLPRSIKHRYCEVAPAGGSTFELAAMIVESTELAREGLTAEMWQKLDHQRWPIATLYPPYRDWEPIVPPRMSGGLFHDYVVKYGPRLTGNVTLDLLSIEHWTRAFENLGPYVPTKYSTIDPHWMERVRHNRTEGLISSLASTCQTYLAVNRCPSAYPVQGAAPDDRVLPVIDKQQIIREALSHNPSDPNVLKAIEFLKRCDG